jgi:hypothetical protein
MANILHFYPGHFHKPGYVVSGTLDTTIGGGLLVFFEDGKEAFRSEAWGGPSKKVSVKGSMDILPTPAGKYVIGPIMRYHTPSWGYSKIKWGTAIKDSDLERSLPEKAKQDVWYKLSNGNWASILKDFNFTRTEIMDRYEQLYGIRRVPKTWVFNDFGPIAIRYFKDLNNNKVLDKNEKLEGTMFHTTPENEAETKRGVKKVSLVPSHGCIHMIPADRSKLISINAFKEGTDLVIFPYDKKYR